MQLDQAFYRLPFRFDVQRLRSEMETFAAEAWLPHPQGHPGNWALPLVSLGGSTQEQGTTGAMAPTPYLLGAPYMRQVLATLQVPVGRSRLMRIEPGGQATSHVDTNYYWAQRVRVHVPIVTDPQVRFECGGEAVHMQAGECWIFDTWRRHNVLNPTKLARVHLVVDTVGSAEFWHLVGAPAEPCLDVSYEAERQVTLRTEAFNFPVVMSPWEIQHWSARVCAALGANPAVESLRQTQDRLYQAWRGLWAEFADAPAGWPHYEAVLEQWKTEMFAGVNPVLPNGISAQETLLQWIGRAALNPRLAGTAPAAESAQRPVATAKLPPPHTTAPTSASTNQPAPPNGSAGATSTHAPRLTRIAAPVFILAAPRSGSSLLFETLARAANAYTVGGESHGIIERFPALTPAHRQFASNALTANDATPAMIEALQQGFEEALRDRDGRKAPAEGALRMLEKTPKNALRVAFLARVFPDARFIYLHREPRANLASIIEAWNSGRFVTYPQLPGWQGKPWSLLLIPEWQQLQGFPLARIAAAQWRAAHGAIMDDLAQLPQDRWCTVNYEAFLSNPQQEVERLVQFADFVWDTSLGELPLSRHTLTPPDPNKWRKHAADIEPLLADLEPVLARLRALEEPVTAPNNATPVAQTPATPAAAPAQAPTPPPIDPSEAHFNSVHTAGIPQLLRDTQSSVFVSTYQAGKLVILRADGSVLNTHFRDFRKPMGVAFHQGRLSVGTETGISTFRNIPAVVPRLPDKDKCDGVFLPRQQHTTGDIQIHELAWAGETLWYVNTSFSCLCTLHPDYSFVPRWRPPFVTALTPEDRCHLNGLALVEGKPRYVTALGRSDTANGWRAKKETGGLVMDVESNTVITEGLCMPHSPRWYEGKLWVLNSGQGGLGTIDLATGKYNEVARMPGFTRGLDFIGRYALVGLSQIRETATFNAIPIAEIPLQERACGVWIVDITTGATVGFTKFTGAVQEIFAVQVARGTAYPELITDDKELIARSYVVPDAALQDVPQHLRKVSATNATAAPPSA